MDKIKSSLASFSPAFYKWKRNKAGLSPVRLRVIYKRETRYYTLNHEGKKLFLSELDWNAIQNPPLGKDGKPVYPRGEKKKIKDLIDDTVANARAAESRATKGNKPFTWEGFEKEFLHNESDKGFLATFRDHLESIKAENRIGTHRAYSCAFVAFNKFRGGVYVQDEDNKRLWIEEKSGKELNPHDITPKLLKDFETFLEKRDCNRTTIGIYMRSLKVAFNLMADNEPTLLETYPFARKSNDRNRYKIRTGSGHKGIVLTLEELRKFIASDMPKGPDGLDTPEHQEAKALFMFSFHCQGMNFKDICLLKYKDIQGEIIRYVRAKTKDTEAAEAIMEVPLTDPIREIILEYGNPDKHPNSYVFTIINDGLKMHDKFPRQKKRTDAERESDIIAQKLKMVNERLKDICDANELPTFTTYAARHSYASLQRANGTPLEEIRELLGHAELRTTENYVKRFDIESKRKANEKISSLLKVS